MKDIAQKIRELREDNDILQSSIAQMLNCTRSTISNYENGRNLPSDVIIAYCKYFNVSADWLLGLSTDRRPGGTPLTRKLEELATLVASAGGEPLTADQLADLLDDFIKYYRHGAPAGNAPTTVLTGFLSAMAVILLVIFAINLKVAPISGGYGFDMLPNFSWNFIVSVIQHYQLPFWSIVLVAIGGQAVGMRSMSIYELNADYVKYARFLGIKDKKVVGYVFRNAMLPQVTGLALSIGTMLFVIFKSYVRHHRRAHTHAVHVPRFRKGRCADVDSHGFRYRRSRARWAQDRQVRL